METPIQPFPRTGERFNNNGAFVLEAKQSEKNRNIIVLLFLPNSAQHFATGLYVGNGTWMWGHYFDNVNEALYDFMERV